MLDFLNGKLKQIFWIGVVIAVSLSLTLMAVLFKDKAEKTVPSVKAKLVSTQKVFRVDEQVVVAAHGIVQAEQEVNLRSEVSGRVIAKNSGLVEGGLVKKGDLLVQIDPGDFLNAVQQEIAALEKAKLELEIERGRQVNCPKRMGKIELFH